MQAVETLIFHVWQPLETFFSKANSQPKIHKFFTLSSLNVDSATL